MTELLHEEDRERIARAIDPDAFDESKPRSSHPMAQLQWGARRIQAREAADNLLGSGLLPALAAVKTAGVREVAAEQRRMAEDARTDVGRAEHTDFADWLEERASEMEGGEGDAARMGLVTVEGEQGLGTCSPEPADAEATEALVLEFAAHIDSAACLNREGDIPELPAWLYAFAERLLKQPIARPGEPEDDEEFCPKCYAGMTAANHDECRDFRLEAAGIRAANAIIYNLPIDGFGDSKRLEEYAAIWGNAAAAAVLGGAK